MRPDEHKKKRSAQYKKTHGISSSKPGHKNSNVQALGKNDGTTSEGRHSDSESDSTVSRPNQNVSTEGKSHSDPLKQQTRLEPTNSENSLHSTEVTSKKKFEKRKIESNWEKYECLDIADDENTLRGQDYQVLLDTTAGLQSGFRFKDEVDWESESSKLDAESEFLSINCAELAEAMLCVPLHQRLRITDSPFQKNEIDVFEQEAKNHASSYSSVVNRNKRIMTDNSDTHSSSSEQSCSKPVSSAETNHSSPENHRTQDGGMHDDLRVSSTSELSDKYAQSSAKVPNFRGGTNKIEETNSTENVNTPIADSSKMIKTDMSSRVTIPDSSTSHISIPKSSESDLDFLLSLETPVVSQISAGQKQIVHQFSQEPSSDLKSSENGAEIQADSKSTVIATNTACDKTTASPAGDDLEDWLDSVLDD